MKDGCWNGLIVDWIYEIVDKMISRDNQTQIRFVQPKPSIFNRWTYETTVVDFQWTRFASFYSGKTLFSTFRMRERQSSHPVPLSTLHCSKLCRLSHLSLNTHEDTRLTILIGILCDLWVNWGTWHGGLNRPNGVLCNRDTATQEGGGNFEWKWNCVGAYGWVILRLRGHSCHKPSHHYHSHWCVVLPPLREEEHTTFTTQAIWSSIWIGRDALLELIPHLLCTHEDKHIY
jgi:hypothetical protein